jgi:ribosomal-protein-alanine N-acetyltransferase
VTNLSFLTRDSASTTTARLSLDRPHPDDLEAMWAIHSDPRTNAHNPAGPMPDRKAAERRLEEWTKHWRQHGFGYWSVRLDDKIIGFAGVRTSAWNGRSAINLYYRFDPSAWGHGYAAEAATAAVDLWRANLVKRPLIAYTKTANIGSQRTALAAGLERRADLDQFTTDPEGSDIVFALGWPSARERSIYR